MQQGILSPLTAAERTLKVIFARMRLQAFGAWAKRDRAQIAFKLQGSASHIARTHARA